MDDPIRNLYYALGEACYAIAMSDGRVQVEERTQLNAILKKEFSRSVSKDIVETEIIFSLLNKEQVNAKTALNWSIKEIKANSHYFSTDMKCHFISTIIKVADSFTPVTEEEKKMLLSFIAEIIDIQEDKVLSPPTSDKN